jgi:hypothetical protein
MERDSGSPLAGASRCSAYCSPGTVPAVCNSILIIYSDHFSAEVLATVRGTGAFTKVDGFNAEIGTPTMEQLAAYDAVLVYTNGRLQDPVLVGDRLAAYHDQGGGVVIATFASVMPDANGLQGAYAEASNGYAMMHYAQGVYDLSPNSIGDILEPLNPLLTDVASFCAYYGVQSTAPVISGRAVVVARWRFGSMAPLVVRGVRGNRTLVELNFFPPSIRAFVALWLGDGAALLRNALKYLRCTLCGFGSFSASIEGEAV